MSLWRLVLRSIGFYWRTNLAVLLAVVVATGVLTGALAVGDSVRFTLQKTLEARLGQVQFAVLPQGRYFRSALTDDLERQLGGTVRRFCKYPALLRTTMARSASTGSRFSV
jgi:putative ABC transport system permease protein